MSEKDQKPEAQDLDFDIFNAPIPETPTRRASWKSRRKAGVKGSYRNDVAVAERDNRAPLKRT
jgi:hypothetical protein